jgi:hypothetical protein
MKNTPVLFISLALTLCLTSLSAQGGSVDFSFEGTVVDDECCIDYPFDVVMGSTVTVTGTYDDDVLTGIGEESVSFESGSRNTLQIDVAPFIYDETDDRRDTTGEFPVLHFMNGALVAFDFFKRRPSPGFRSVSDEFYSADYLEGTWDFEDSFQTIPIQDDDDDDGVLNDDELCPDTAMDHAVDAVGCSDAQVDRDGDGVCDLNAASGGPGMCAGTDYCPDNTMVPEDVVPTVRLNPNHWALIDGDNVFDTMVKGARGRIGATPSRTPTAARANRLSICRVSVPGTPSSGAALVPWITGLS